MILQFKDGSTLAVERVLKSYDFSSYTTRLNIDLPIGSDLEECMGKDYTKFTLSRPGFEDVMFENYSIENLTEDYNDATTQAMLSLLKNNETS